MTCPLSPHLICLASLLLEYVQADSRPLTSSDEGFQGRAVFIAGVNLHFAIGAQPLHYAHCHNWSRTRQLNEQGQLITPFNIVHTLVQALGFGAGRGTHSGNSLVASCRRAVLEFLISEIITGSSFKEKTVTDAHLQLAGNDVWYPVDTHTHNVPISICSPV
eukprot:5903351-Amphidinium_carterae.1